MRSLAASLLLAVLLPCCVLAPPPPVCVPGTYGNPGVCLPCGLGQYSSVSNATQCSVCSSGTFANTNSSVNCTSCPNGTYSGQGWASCSNTTCAPGEAFLTPSCLPTRETHRRLLTLSQLARSPSFQAPAGLRTGLAPSAPPACTPTAIPAALPRRPAPSLQPTRLRRRPVPQATTSRCPAPPSARLAAPAFSHQRSRQPAMRARWAAPPLLAHLLLPTAPT